MLSQFMNMELQVQCIALGIYREVGLLDINGYTEISIILLGVQKMVLSEPFPILIVRFFFPHLQQKSKNWIAIEGGLPKFAWAAAKSHQS